jgi:outer membrane autotransporter protein
VQDSGINSPTLLWTAIYNARSVDLMLERNYTKESIGLTANQLAVGNVFNAWSDITTGDIAEVLNAVDYLTDNAGVRAAYQQVTPDKAAYLTDLALNSSSFLMREQAQRLSNLRFGKAGTGSETGSYKELLLAYNSPNFTGLLDRDTEASNKSWGLYLYPSHTIGSRQATANQTGYRAATTGFTLGADFRLRNSFIIGLAGGFNHSRANFDSSGGDMRNDTWPLTAYGAYLGKTWYAYGSLGYTLNHFDLTRNINYSNLQRTAKSSTTGRQFATYAEAGYDLKTKKAVFTPVVSLAYSRIAINDFAESGAGALNLKVESQQSDSLQTGLGLKVAVPFKWEETVVVPEFYATYQHEFAQGSRDINASFSQTGNAFTFQTEAPGRDFTVLGANVEVMIKENLRLGFNFNTEVGRSNYTAHSLYGGLRWLF